MRRELAPFRFKDFSVDHSHSTIPVGTDAVLLGAWVSLDKVERALDVGTGTGVISLCIRQRSSRLSFIHALDIDFLSVMEANRNFNNSPWGSSFSAFYTPFNTHGLDEYDLIFSNPPFFRNSQKNELSYEEKARHQTDFDMYEFALSCKGKLSPNGTVALIYPADDFEYLKEVFDSASFFLKRVCTVYSKRNKQPSRVMVEFSLAYIDLVKEQLVIYEIEGGYTSEYKSLTKDFYLNF